MKYLFVFRRLQRREKRGDKAFALWSASMCIDCPAVASSQLSACRSPTSDRNGERAEHESDVTGLGARSNGA
jgi:hypothetical protein